MKIIWNGSRPCHFFYEGENFKAVHACWDNQNIGYLRSTLVKDRLTDELIYKSVKEGTELYESIDQTLKGKEIKMPDGLSFTDKDGIDRNKIRIKWWENPASSTYKSISVIPNHDLPERQINLSELKLLDHYGPDDKIVFFGHYWLEGDLNFHKDNICCLDYSVAKGGKLVAYRLKEESVLDRRNFIYV